MTGPVQGRYTVRCQSCRAAAYVSDSAPHPDPAGRLREFADTECPRGGVGCPHTTVAREHAADLRPARLLARLQQWADRVRALEQRPPRTVLVPVPALPAGRHDIPVAWPEELPAAPRVQVTLEVPRPGASAGRVVVLAGSRTRTGCVVVLDTTLPVAEGQAFLHVTATP